jgi:hypothetical protein
VFEVIQDMHTGPVLVPRNTGSYSISDSIRETFMRECGLYHTGLVNPPQMIQGYLESDLNFEGLRALESISHGWCYDLNLHCKSHSGTTLYYEQWWDERDYGIDTEVFDRLALTGDGFLPELKRDYVMFKLSAEQVNDRFFVIP